MKSHQQLFAELKRRRVFKVTFVYGAVAFALIQVADPLTKALLLPDAFLTYVAAILLLGFPLTLVLTWAFEVTPEGVRKTERASPEEIAAIIAQPASQRWSAGIFALLGITALIAGAWWAGRRSGEANAETAGAGPTSETRLAFAPLENDQRPSIAVLPFADMSPQGDQEYFSDGMAEELLNTLAKIPELRVAARTSTFAFKNTSLTAAQLGDTLHVQYFVEGSVRKAGDRLRITAQLIDTSSGSHLWSNTYDRTLDDVFAIQTEIAEGIADQLRLPLGLEGPLVTPTADLDAYDLYLAARARVRERGGTVLNEAVRLYEAAIAADSGWAPPWAGLAEALEVRLWYPDAFGDGPVDPATIDRDLAAAERAARRALELDPRDASAHVALGNVLRDRYDWQPAERAYREAISLDPDNAEAFQQYAELLMASGRIAEAVRVADRTVLLDPAPVRYFVLGSALWCDDRTAQAKQAFEEGVKRGGSDKVGGLWLVLFQLSYAGGRFGEAEEHLRERALSAGTDADSLVMAFRHRREAIENADSATSPDTTFSQLRPLDWLALGRPDSAAAALAHGGYNYGMGLEISRLYQVCRPEFDVIRSRPAVMAYVRERGLDGRITRTPPDEREPPAALR